MRVSGRQRGEVGLKARVADGGGLDALDLDPLARGQTGDRAEHRDPVIAVGVDRAAAQAAAALDRDPVRARLDLSAERAAAPSLTAAIRSDSLRRSSAASRILVVPFSEAGGERHQGQLVDRQRHLGAADLDPRAGPTRRTRMRADRLAATFALRLDLEPAPPSARGSSAARCGSG